MKKLMLPVYMIAFLLLCTACSANTPKAVSSPAPQAEAAQPTAHPQDEASAPPASIEAAATPQSEAARDMAQKTKDFILKGQDDLPEAGKLHWTEEFLNLVDMESMYQEYIASGLVANDVEGFAKYLTENAPVPEDWKDMFEAAFAEAYGETIVKYELIEDTYYEVTVSIDGTAVPYVAVNARTGWYHG